MPIHSTHSMRNSKSSLSSIVETVTVPPSLLCETAIPLKLLTSPSVSWPRLCWNRRLSWLGGLPSPLHSHCVSLESASATPVYTQKQITLWSSAFWYSRFRPTRKWKLQRSWEPLSEVTSQTPPRLRSKTKGWINVCVTTLIHTFAL